MSFNQIIELGVKDCFLVYGKRFNDSRGYFEEIYNESKFEKSISSSWKQVSVAQSKAGVLRGLHCSNYAKYVTCLQGQVIDVVVDLRPDSPTYLKYIKVTLDSNLEDPVYLYVPKRCGHGYYCKEDSIFMYLQDGCYNNKEDIEVNLFDTTLSIDWPKPNNEQYIISDKDRNNFTIKQIVEFLCENKISPHYSEIINKGLNLNIEKGIVSAQNGKKNVMITGGAGFIASHLAILLTKKYPNYNIFVYDVLDYCSNIKNLNSVIDFPNFKFIQGDICDFNMVKFVMKEFKIDWILHFAAQSHVDISLKNSLKFTETNVKGTHVLLECSRLNNIKKFIHVSTDEVYGTTDSVANINQALDPTNPYACSKLAAECIIKAYQKCFQIPIIISRGNNVYGPHQFLEKVIPKFINRLFKNKKCCIHGDGSSERDFLYVDDVAEAFDLLIHKGIPDNFYNIGASKSISVLELARKIVQIVKKTDPGKEDEYIDFVEGRILDDKRYKIDSTRIYELGWRQNVYFEEGLKKTVEWYANHQDYWDNVDYALEPHPFSVIRE